MIVSKTPLRVSFFGGGTDALKYIEGSGWGAVLSTTVQSYVYVAISRNFYGNVRAYYTGAFEAVKNVGELQNKYIREILKSAGIENGVDVYVTTDSVAKGGGLGGSAALMVGLLNSAHAFMGKRKGPAELEAEATRLGTDKNGIGDTTGRQDQAAAAFGGFNVMKFFRDGRVEAEPLKCGRETLGTLEGRLVQFYLGGSRSASEILFRQEKKIADELELRTELRSQVDVGRRLLEAGKLDDFGKLLNGAWELKKRISGVSNPEIDKYYASALKAGALGGKLSGAGGTGFLLFYCPDGTKDGVRKALSGLKEVSLKFEPRGTTLATV